MFGWVRGLSLLLLLSISSLSFAYILESGDTGKQFAANKASEICTVENIEAVYVCLGNVVKAVSSVPGYGSTFYKPDGKVVHCPVVAPTDMGAECLQMMTPNYCPVRAECGTSPEQTFPGQNGTPEQSNPTGYDYVDKTQPKEEKPAVGESPIKTNENQTTKTNGSQVVPGSMSPPPAPVATPRNFDFSLDNLALVVLLLGVVSVAVLFLLFKSSLSE